MATTEARPIGLVPGLAALVALAVLATTVGNRLPLVDSLVIAIALGVLVANTVGVPAVFEPGVARYGLLLETAIVLLGASVPLADLLSVGPALFALVIGTVVVGLVLVEAVSRYVLELQPRYGSLLAAGASICGVSAVVAVARAIDADREAVAYVAGAILFFDALTLVAVPLVGGVLGLTDRAFGVWAGLVMFSTGPVTAAGFSYSPAAGQWAAVTKLLRNALIAVLVVGYAVAYTDRARDLSRRDWLRSIPGQIPGFLVGFAVVLAIANTGVVSPAGLDAIRTATDWLFAIAFVGVGLSIRLAELRDVGSKPVAGLLAYLLVVGSLALFAVMRWL